MPGAPQPCSDAEAHGTWSSAGFTATTAHLCGHVNHAQQRERQRRAARGFSDTDLCGRRRAPHQYAKAYLRNLPAGGPLITVSDRRAGTQARRSRRSVWIGLLRCGPVAARRTGCPGAALEPFDAEDARSCRNEGVAYARIYAQRCIIFHDSASTLTSQRRLLRHLFIWTHRARSPNAESHIRGQDVQLGGSARGYQEFSRRWLQGRPQYHVVQRDQVCRDRT